MSDAAAAPATYKLVLIRHGESEWNRSNRFTGWTDVGLTETGVTEAHAGAALLKESGYTFDIAFTSVLKRAIKTLWIILEDLGEEWIPVVRDYRLNERHYGALQGLNKAETAEKHGEDQVKIWRRAFAIPPPELEESDARHPSHDPRYAGLPADVLPKTESLKTTIDRVLPFWQSAIAPAIQAGKRVLVAAHGNSLRALVKYLDGISDDDIVELNIPTGVPLVYELDADLKPIRHYYLGNAEEVAAKQAAVAAQAAVKK